MPVIELSPNRVIQTSIPNMEKLLSIAPQRKNKAKVLVRGSCFNAIISGLSEITVYTHQQQHLRPERAPAEPGSEFCKAKVGVEGDLDPFTGQIIMRHVEGIMGSMFETLHMQRAPTTAGQVDLRKKNLFDGDLLAPIKAAYAKSEEVTVHRCCPVPVEIMTALTGHWYKPLDLVDTLIEWNAARETPIKDTEFHALNWAKLASTRVFLDEEEGVEDNPPMSTQCTTHGSVVSVETYRSYRSPRVGRSYLR
eukprot:CAMPEP_0113478758 /NCGR_PEP_ID=MMETSP0014_2-20120614/20932_1 /TAXON_ID=2857 /ORGANISM="Nitzschia sp." /LENGTH=250 /DNA_ID=CAMNT_0000371981 /DNA_START=358 /DNA_END=1110 /DNA_ORIENTATION=- /assembly_acc=CAM_ASM_000159